MFAIDIDIGDGGGIEEKLLLIEENGGIEGGAPP